MKIINAEIQFALVAEDEYNAKIVLNFEGRGNAEFLLTSMPGNSLEEELERIVQLIISSHAASKE